MPDPANRRNTGPRAICELLAFHAQEIAPYLRPPARLGLAGTDPAMARQLAVRAAACALATLDPQDAIEALTVRGILMTTHIVLRPGHSEALARHQRITAAMQLRSLEERQARMRTRAARSIPERRRKTFRWLDVPPVVP
jgi:hypothetical protein